MTARHASPPTPRADRRPGLTIYFDGACPVCTSEIAMLGARDRDGRLAFFDCGGEADDGVDDAARAAGLTSADLRARIHARDEVGRWITGVDVFAAAYRAAGLGWIAGLLEARPLRPLWTFTYRWVVAHRPVLRRLGVQRVFGALRHRAGGAQPTAVARGDARRAS